MPYFNIKRSITSHGWHKWYWSLHEVSGHIYHISQGHEVLTDCLDDLALNGNEWMQDLCHS